MRGLHYFRQPWHRQLRILVSWALCNFLWALGGIILEVFWKPALFVRDWATEIWIAAFGPLERPPAPLPPQKPLGWVLREYYDRCQEAS